VIVVTLVPLSVGPDPQVLAKIAPGIIWVAALLAILLSLGNLFRYDVEEGFLDLILLSPYPLSLLVLCKVLSHWLLYCLPLILISPLVATMLNLDSGQLYALILSLLFGTPALCLLGAVGAALVVGIRYSGLLLPLIIMPLYVPLLIFGTQAVSVDALSGHLAILAALSLFYLAFCPWLAAAALRVGAD
jgi:heme exporter protein B